MEDTLPPGPRDGRYEAIIAAGPLLVFTIDRDGRFTLSEGRALERLGRKPNDVRGMHFRDVYASLPEVLAAVEAAQRGVESRVEFAVGDHWFEAHYRPTTGPGGTIDGVTGVAFDITDRVIAQEDRDRLIAELRENEARYRMASSHDSLTGLPNRLLFMAELNRAIAHARRHGQQLGLAYIDIDRFKRINDTCGHAAGDRVLRAFATHLSSSVRAGDLVARLAGDEFAVLLDPGPDGRLPAHAVTRLAGPVLVPGACEATPLTIQASVGLAHYPADGEDAESLLRVADRAMYEAKRASGVARGAHAPVTVHVPEQPEGETLPISA